MQGKRVMILGMARSGVAAAKLLSEKGAFVRINDLKTREQLGDALRFVKENDVVKILSHNGNVFGVEPPLFVELVVTHTEPGAKGNTATNVMKPATLETGAVINVPLFVEIGTKIKIDTRTGEYLSRA